MTDGQGVVWSGGASQVGRVLSTGLAPLASPVLGLPASWSVPILQVAGTGQLRGLLPASTVQQVLLELKCSARTLLATVLNVA